MDTGQSIEGEWNDTQPISLPSNHAVRRADLTDWLCSTVEAHRTALLGFLRQAPGFVFAVQKLATDGTHYRVLVSKENAALLREGMDGITKPWLRREGRFVENVDLVRVPPDISGAVASLAIQAALTEISVKLDRVIKGVDNLAQIIAQANEGSLKGAITALEVAHRLRDPGERRMEMLGACRQVLLQLGAVTGQMKAHIQQMPVAETSFFDGWNGDWETEAEKAYGRVRDDFAAIANGVQRVLAAYWDLGEFEAAQDAFSRISNDLNAAGIETAAERARLLSFTKDCAAPERVFTTFVAARLRIEERLRDMADNAGPALELVFSLEELVE